MAKRPNYVRPDRAGLPTRPSEQPRVGAKPGKPAKSQKPKKLQKSAKVATIRAVKQPTAGKSTSQRKVSERQLRAEQRKLTTIYAANRNRAKSQAKAFTSEVRRFTAASRRRAAVVTSLVTSVGLLLAILLATWFTPILAIEKIEISGLHRLKEKTVAKAVESLIGTPLTLVDENQIAQRLQNFALIESFSTISNPPHTLELRIVERQPISIVMQGQQAYLFDAAGVQIGLAEASDKLPIVSITGNPAKSENYRQAIDVLLALPVELNNRISTIKATSKDNVQLTLSGSASRVVVWGDSSNSILKSKVLSALLKTTKRSASVIFDVSSPEAPAVQYLNY